MSQPAEFDYQRYLASREWALRRRRIIERADYGEFCERCRTSKGGGVVVVAVHHRTYARIGHENDDDLLGVCAECHAFLSGRSDYDPLRHFLTHEVREGLAPASVLAALDEDPNRTYDECWPIDYGPDDE